MAQGSGIHSVISGDEHWVSFAVGLVVVVLLALLLNIQWFWLLVFGAVVSGVVDLAIKEVPPDTENYDQEQYALWDAAFGAGNADVDELQENLQRREQDKNAPESNEAQPDGLDTLRDRYARGELTEEQFERKVEHLLETDTPENATEWQESDREPIKE